MLSSDRLSYWHNGARQMAIKFVLAIGGVVAGAAQQDQVMQPAAGEKPHILMLLADDYGWANAGWHRDPNDTAEVRTPVMDGLVKSGIELDRAYQYKYCSPSRCSLQSGRLPVHVNMWNIYLGSFNPDDPISGFAGIPRNMTGVAEHLKRAGYNTHQIGKWDAGMATPDHTPRGRGYDTSLGFFDHMNDYWTMQTWQHVDLWDTERPAYGMNGSAPPETHEPKGTWLEDHYEEFKFKVRALSIIANHDPMTPLFLCYCFHIAHEPLQVPERVFNEFSMDDDLVIDGLPHRKIYAAMVKYMDEAIGEIVGLLQAKGMWQNTLVVFQSDNGGPSFEGAPHTANNFPLKGTKMSNWEGGIRGNAFVSGGFLQKAAPRRVGTKLEGYTHICDWYATFAALAGVDPTDHKAAKAGLPPIDSMNLWPYLSGQQLESPRAEVFADPDVLIVGDWKIIGANATNASSPGQRGTMVFSACWHGPKYPNASSVPGYPGCNRSEPCADNGGCLYNIRDDPSEYTDLASSNPAKLAELKRRLSELQPSVFDPKRDGGGTELPERFAREVYRGFWGPFIDVDPIMYVPEADVVI